MPSTPTPNQLQPPVPDTPLGPTSSPHPGLNLGLGPIRQPRRAFAAASNAINKQYTNPYRNPDPDWIYYPKTDGKYERVDHGFRSKGISALAGKGKTKKVTAKGKGPGRPKKDKGDEEVGVSPVGAASGSGTLATSAMSATEGLGSSTNGVQLGDAQAGISTGADMPQASRKCNVPNVDPTPAEPANAPPAGGVSTTYADNIMTSTALPTSTTTPDVASTAPPPWPTAASQATFSSQTDASSARNASVQYANTVHSARYQLQQDAHGPSYPQLMGPTRPGLRFWRESAPDQQQSTPLFYPSSPSLEDDFPTLHDDFCPQIDDSDARQAILGSYAARSVASAAHNTAPDMAQASRQPPFGPHFGLSTTQSDSDPATAALSFSEQQPMPRPHTSSNSMEIGSLLNPESQPGSPSVVGEGSNEWVRSELKEIQRTIQGLMASITELMRRTERLSGWVA